jgi:hypothetical protein
MKVTSSRTFAACQGSAGVNGVCGYWASSQSTMTWLSHSPPSSVRMNGTLPSGVQASTASSLDLVMTRSSVKGMPFSSSTIFTLL